MYVDISAQTRQIRHHGNPEGGGSSGMPCKARTLQLADVVDGDAMSVICFFLSLNMYIYVQMSVDDVKRYGRT